MRGQLVHFELPAHDAARATAFWSSLFGWRFRESSEPVPYHMFEGEPGGAVYPSTDSAGSGPIVYFESDDVDADLARIRELGGSVEQEKQPIPGIGWFARCRDTEGNSFSLFQSDGSVAS